MCSEPKITDNASTRIKRFLTLEIVTVWFLVTRTKCLLSDKLRFVTTSASFKPVGYHLTRPIYFCSCVSEEVWIWMIDSLDSIYIQRSLNVIPEVPNVTWTPLAAKLLEATYVNAKTIWSEMDCYAWVGVLMNAFYIKSLYPS